MPLLTPTEIYEAVCRNPDERTRRVLLRQFVEKYFPKAYEVLTGVPGAPDSAPAEGEAPCPNSPDGHHSWQDARRNTIVACLACGAIR